MPYKSEAQRRFFNSPSGKKKIGKEEVEKWNEESKGQKNLPEKVSDTLNKAIQTCDSPYIKNDELKRIINDLENIASRVESVSNKIDSKDSPSVRRSSQDIKEVANNLKLFVK